MPPSAHELYQKLTNGERKLLADQIRTLQPNQECGAPLPRITQPSCSGLLLGTTTSCQTIGISPRRHSGYGPVADAAGEADIGHCAHTAWGTDVPVHSQSRYLAC